MYIVRLKRILHLLLAILMVVTMLSLSACNSKKEGSAQSTATSTEAATTVEAAPEDGPFTKYEPAIEMRWVRDVDDYFDKDMQTLKEKTGETLEKNRWLDVFEKDLGIKVKYDWIAKTGDPYNQKFTLAMASGELPDYFWCNGIQLKQLAESDMIQDLTQDNKQYFMNEFYGVPTPTMVEKLTTLIELQDSTATKIILGSLDSDAGFDKFVEDWKKLGGDKITEEVNQWKADMGK